MSYRGQSDDLGMDLDVYGEGEEATWRRAGTTETDLEQYDEDDAPTLPWMRHMN